jgi:hypothetical protein
MNLRKLKEAERAFLHRYPGGFNHPEIAAVRKKRHNADIMIAFAQECFSTGNFRFPDQIVENMVKLVSRSSVLSMFEKPRFRDFVYSLSSDGRKLLTLELEALLHGNQQMGFERLLKLLQKQKLAKWPLMTIFQTYYHSQQEVFVKPTTVKGIIQYFELKNLQYNPTPTWAFYEDYRSTLIEMKSRVDPSLSPSNIAFSWFLLLSFHHQVF